MWYKLAEENILVRRRRQHIYQKADDLLSVVDSKDRRTINGLEEIRGNIWRIPTSQLDHYQNKLRTLESIISGRARRIEVEGPVGCSPVPLTVQRPGEASSLSPGLQGIWDACRGIVGEGGRGILPPSKAVEQAFIQSANSAVKNKDLGEMRRLLEQVEVMRSRWERMEKSDLLAWAKRNWCLVAEEFLVKVIGGEG